MKKGSAYAVFFTVIMLICVLFIVWYLPAVSQRRFQLGDTQKSLETSLGRERKQQSEYDENGYLRWLFQPPPQWAYPVGSTVARGSWLG